MIIYGSRTLVGTKGQGNFHCPRCQMAREYRHMAGRRWFTLYFIPIIPLWSAGEYIECPSCGESYGMEVLNYRPDPASASGSVGGGSQGGGDVLADIRRSLVLTLLAAGRTGPSDLNNLYQWWLQSGMAPITPYTLQEDMQLAQQANAQLGPFVQARLQSLDMNGRITLVRTARHVLVGSGYPTPSDEQALRILGVNLQLQASTTDPIIRGG